MVANIDDYKLQTSVAVPFPFNKYVLTDEAKEDLDKLATDVQTGQALLHRRRRLHRQDGFQAYNEVLSRSRADSVMEYLVAKHDIPIYRIHMIGLGQEKPVDEARNREARAKNRRVEVKVFSADQVTAPLNSTNGATEGNLRSQVAAPRQSPFHPEPEAAMRTTHGCFFISGSHLPA